MIDFTPSMISGKNQDERRTSRYFTEFIKTRASAQLLSLSLFPDAKEMTESMGAYNAVRTHLTDWSLDDRGISCVVVGDGSTPRTAALFAMRTAWKVYSVDPRLKHDGKHSRIDRLWQYSGPIQKFHLKDYRLLVVCVHSHAPIDPTLDNLIGVSNRAMICIPCCNFDTIPHEKADVEYDDFGIWSGKRHVMVWRSL